MVLYPYKKSDEWKMLDAKALTYIINGFSAISHGKFDNWKSFKVQGTGKQNRLSNKALAESQIDPTSQKYYNNSDVSIT